MMYLQFCLLGALRKIVVLLWPGCGLFWSPYAFFFAHCCSVAKSCPTLCNPINCSTPSFSVLHQLLDFAQTHVIESVMPSNHLILCHALLLLTHIFPSIRIISSESVLPLRWQKYWSFSFSITPSNEYSRLILFTIDWFDLAVQGTLKSLLQHHSSKASVLRCSGFFMV